MAYTLTMPEVGETVTEGTIERWLKQPGEQITKYDPIVEINTDKVNVELPSPVSGTIREILAPEGTTVSIHAALAVIDEVAGETPAEVSPPAPAEKPPEREAAAPAAPEPAPAAATRAVAEPPAHNGQRQRHRATPRVRHLAEGLHVDLAQVSGTGPGGRILEEDVRAAAQTRKAPASAPAAVAERPPEVLAPPPAAAPGAEEESVPVTAIRRTIAQRMSASAFSAPHAWLVVEADASGLVQLRTAMRESFRQRHGGDLTYLPFVAHAVAQSLLDHPYLNASWAEDRILLKKQVNLGVAMATERGLLVPVIQSADRLSVTGLASAVNDLTERTRSNRLQLEDVQGGTFTLDNTGAFGSIVSMPIINQGQSAIMSLEAIRREPRVVADSAIAIRSVVNLCLSFDHRVLDGHQAGAFLRDVKRRLEAFSPDSGID